MPPVRTVVGLVPQVLVGATGRSTVTPRLLGRLSPASQVCFSMDWCSPAAYTLQNGVVRHFSQCRPYATHLYTCYKGNVTDCLQSYKCTWSPRLDGPSGQLIQVRTAKTQRKELTERPDEGAVTVGEKVKQAGKDATYTGIVILGIGVTALMFYAVGRELFSGDSPNGIYTQAFKKCKRNEELVDAIGEPMKGYGELTRRGRRRHTSHSEYEVDGMKIMRMKFYVEGPFNKGTAQLEVRKGESGGRYQFRYLFVTIDAYPHQTITIEDNR